MSERENDNEQELDDSALEFVSEGDLTPNRLNLTECS